MVRVENVDAGRRVVEGIPVEDMGIQVLVSTPSSRLCWGRARLYLARQLVVDDNAAKSSSVR